MIKIRLAPEKIFLTAFFGLMLFLGPGILFGHKISHDYPFGYGASDAFQHQIRAEAIKDAGNFRYEAPYISKGFEKVVGRYPPILYHLAVILSYSAGIEVYDSIYFIVVFFAIIASLLMYLIIREFNNAIALISLPLSLLIFSYPVSAGILLGHWPSLLSQGFLILLFWTILRRELNYSYLLIALAMAATTLTHTSETIFGAIFLAIFFIIKLLFKNLKKSEIKNMALTVIIFLVISFYYLVIFWNTWRNQGYSFAFQPVWEENPGFYIAGFGLLLIPIILGLIFSMFDLKNAHAAIIAGITMLTGGFLNYIGFELRSFQIRFFWPVYLSVFFGIGIYYGMKFVIKKRSIIYTAILFIVFCLLFIGIIKFPPLKETKHQVIPYIPQLDRATSQGLMNPFHWEAFKWLSEKTEKDAKIYFFYGDIYSQDALLRNSKRIHYQVDPDDFIKALQERKIKRVYISELPGDNGGGIKVRKSFFVYENADRNELEGYSSGPKDICSFDYLIFDKLSRVEALWRYNLIIAEDILKKDFIGPVFENDVVAILKNKNKGGDCIEEREF